MIFVAILVGCSEAESLLRATKDHIESVSGIGQGDAEVMIRKLKK